jgi:hypothetical protein
MGLNEELILDRLDTNPIDLILRTCHLKESVRFSMVAIIGGPLYGRTAEHQDYR